MKRVRLLLIAVIILASVFACYSCKDDTGDENGGVAERELSGIALQYAEIGKSLNSLIRENYWDAKREHPRHYYPNSPEQGGKFNVSFAFVWPYTEMVASQAALARLFTDASDVYIEVLDSFEHYRRAGGDYWSYSSDSTLSKGKGDSYYDDNIWIAREFLNAYEILGTESYFDAAKGVCEYVWSGWANDEMGGIFWKEEAKEARHACSNAPAAILFSRMYLATGEQKYLDRALATYKFCIEYLRDTDGVYFDNISNKGAVDKKKYTYNTGSMISAGIHLYEITGDEQYLNDARESAAGSYDYFFEARDGYDFNCIKNATPWFNLLLLDGYIELYKYDASAYGYISNYEKNMLYAYDTYVTAEFKFMPANWINGFEYDKDGKLEPLNILNMAANAENFSLLAYFYHNIYAEAEAD